MKKEHILFFLLALFLPTARTWGLCRVCCQPWEGQEARRVQFGREIVDPEELARVGQRGCGRRNLRFLRNHFGSWSHKRGQRKSKSLRQQRRGHP